MSRAPPRQSRGAACLLSCLQRHPAPTAYRPSNLRPSTHPPLNLRSVDEFAASFRAKGYSSCWGDVPNARSATTFNARTYLQAQLQKAARSDEKETKGDKNPKVSAAGFGRSCCCPCLNVAGAGLVLLLTPPPPP